MFDQRLNQLSAQIAKMTPQQRQQFATLHKNDPILVSLTKFVNDQDQAVRNGVLAAKAPEAVNQPKVVDQTISQMGQPQGGPMITPPPRASQAGVAGLPAPNLTGMPDGGIAGQPDQAPQAPSFAAGGAVRYAGGGGILYGPMGIPITGPDDVPLYGYSPSDATPILDRTAVSKAAKKADAKGGRPVWRDDPRLLGPVQSPYEQLREKNMAEVNASAVPPPVAVEPPKPEDPVRAAMLKLLTEGGGGAPAAGGGAGVGSGGTGAPRAGGLAALAPAAGAPAPAQLDINAAFDQRMAALPKEVAPDQRAGLAAARSDAAQADLDELQRQQGERGQAGADREKRLTERGAKLDAAENENKGLALLSAGLAMMAGTSPNAFANIGQGAQVGVKQYQEGKQRLDAARERLDDAFFQLEELRRNEKRMDDKELRDAKKGVRSAVVENMQDAYKAVADMYGVNAKTAMGMVDAAVKQSGQQLEASTRLQAAQIGANAQVQSAGIHAGATAAAAKQASADRRYATQVAGLGALLRNDPENPMKQNQLMLQAQKQALAEIKANPNMQLLEMSNPGQFQAQVQQRAQQILQGMQGMSQFGAPSSSAAGPANFRYNPQTGNIDPYQ